MLESSPCEPTTKQLTELLTDPATLCDFEFPIDELARRLVALAEPFLVPSPGGLEYGDRHQLRNALGRALTQAKRGPIWMTDFSHIALQYLLLHRRKLPRSVAWVDDAQLLDTAFETNIWTTIGDIPDEAIKAIVAGFTAARSVAHLVDRAKAGKITSEQVDALVAAFAARSYGTACELQLAPVREACVGVRRHA